MTAKEPGLEMQDQEVQAVERDVFSEHDLKAGAAVDDIDMQRMGKTQEFKVCVRSTVLISV